MGCINAVQKVWKIMENLAGVPEVGAVSSVDTHGGSNHLEKSQVARFCFMPVLLCRPFRPRNCLSCLCCPTIFCRSRDATRSLKSIFEGAYVRGVETFMDDWCYWLMILQQF